MVKSKLDFLKMKIESMFVDTFKSSQSGFGVAPKKIQWDPCVTIPLIWDLSVANSSFPCRTRNCFLYPRSTNPLYPPPGIRMNYTLLANSTTNNSLKSFLGCIGYDFSIDLSVPVKITEYDGFTTRSTTSFPLNTSGTEIAFLDFNNPREGRFTLTKGSYSFPNRHHITVDCGTADMGVFCDLSSTDVIDQKLQSASEFGFRNSCAKYIPINSRHHNNLAPFSSYSSYLDP